MKVKFMPSGEEHEIEVNETVLHLANRAGLHIQSVCKGIPSCAECRIQIVEGEHHVLPPSKKEIDLIGTAHYVDMSRLSCQLRCFGDIVVDLQEQIEKEKRAQQKPKDRRARPDGEKSRAVLGGILDNVVAADVALPDELEEKVEKVEVEAVSGDPHLDRRDAFYGDFYKGKKKKQGGQHQGQRSSGQQPQRGSGQQSQKASAQQPDKEKSRKRKRRRGGKKGGGANAAAPAPQSES